MNSEHVKMIKKLTLKAVALAGVAIAMQAGATTITVTPWLAPNAFGSPSFVLAQTNALTALYSGAATAGAVGPSQFNAQTTALTGSQTVVTGFASWRGVVDPGTVFGAAYAAEGGNRMHFGVLIDGQGSQFSISQLNFEGYSTDAGHVLNFNFPSGAYDYSEAFQGIRYGLDGHLGGDAALKTVARIVERSVQSMRDGDQSLVARYGGEELVVLLPGVGEAGARRIAESIREAVMRTPIPFEEGEFHVTLSAGVAARCETVATSRALISASDAALYKAKANGRNRVEVTSETAGEK